MTEREALNLALQALETLMIERGSIYDKAITAIKEALAQPWEKFCDSNCVWTDHHPDCKLAEQEPVAWATRMGEYAHIHWGAKRPEYPMVYEVPLYTHPPPVAEPHKRKPLTDEEIEKMCPKFEDPMRREMWMTGFKTAYGIKEGGVV